MPSSVASFRIGNFDGTGRRAGTDFPLTLRFVAMVED